MAVTRFVRKSIEANNNLIKRAQKNAEAVKEWYNELISVKCKDAYEQVPEEKLKAIVLDNGLISLENLESNVAEIDKVQKVLDEKAAAEKAAKAADKKEKKDDEKTEAVEAPKTEETPAPTEESAEAPAKDSIPLY